MKYPKLPYVAPQLEELVPLSGTSLLASLSQPIESDFESYEEKDWLGE